MKAYLFWWQPALDGNVTHPAFRNHHSLWTPKATECCIGRQVGFTDCAYAADVWDVVRVVHVKHSSVHNLLTNGHKIGEEYPLILTSYYFSRPSITG